jgi:hypothetical protein
MVRSFPYFIYQGEQGRCIEKEVWYRECSTFDIEDVFEVLIRHDTGTLGVANIVWGDKSPSYIARLELIKVSFPEARIIHIVRDVRDYCASIRQAWGKNIYRAADRWRKDLIRFNQFKRKYNEYVTEVRYEDLLADPVSEMSRLSRFLGLEFDRSMLEIGGDVENLGDTKGLAGIQAGNMNKYSEKIREESIERIERIALPMMERYGYEPRYAMRHVPLFEPLSGLFWLQDSIRLISRSVNKRGVRAGIRFSLSYFRITGNRN